MAGAGHSECLAHDDRAPRVRCLVYRGERPDTLADRPLLFGAGTHEEARVVDEVHEGQAERVAKIDEARHLFGGGGVNCARVKRRVVGHHPDRDAI